MNQEPLQKIIAVLEESDIVWSKYGSQTIKELAQKIAETVKENEVDKLISL